MKFCVLSKELIKYHRKYRTYQRRTMFKPHVKSVVSLCQAYNNHCWHYRRHTLCGVNEKRNNEKTKREGRKDWKEGRKEDRMEGKLRVKV